MDEILVFSNTCGKIYADNVIFAFSNGEKEINTKKIAGVKFSERFTAKSLMIMFLPFPVLILLYLERDLHMLLKLAGFGVMLAVLVLCFIYAERKYRICITMQDGSQLDINLSKNNRKDARKFVDKLKESAGV